MKKIILFFLILSSIQHKINAISNCATGQFSIVVNGSALQGFTISDGIKNVMRVSKIDPLLNTNDLQCYICPTLAVPATCGFEFYTDVCYEIKPIDVDIAFKIKFNATACVNGVGSLVVEYNQTTQSFSLGNAGNTNAYSLTDCRPCLNDVILNDPLFSTNLTESSTWIKGQNLFIDPLADVKFDAHPDDGFVELEDGFETIPTSGEFMAQALDGCGSFVPGALKLELKAYLEGALGNSSIMAEMQTNLGVASKPNVTDYIDVSLVHPTTLSRVIRTATPLSKYGIAEVEFPDVSPGLYYVVLNHRHSIETWSEVPINIGTSPTYYNFAMGPQGAYGNNQKAMPSGVKAIYTGDVNQDENIDILDVSDVEADASIFAFGYEISDVNWDANVDILDNPIVENNFFIYSMHP